tara:strand:- start:322 stop:546 length:225 start_codon:yes stop_codon:yes gene_type:complete
MSRLKQRIKAFRTAESEYNKRYVALRNEFTSQMHKACKGGDMDYFEALKEDFRKYFDEDFTICSIEVMYGLNDA